MSFSAVGALPGKKTVPPWADMSAKLVPEGQDPACEILEKGELV